jgi:glycosyltransferase involved in cell wall biosynthesis
MPLISIVIPVYNGEKTLRATLQSVLEQTCLDFELIIINDGSKDSTLKIISDFSDARIQVFSYENAGLATSRNRGMSHATGEFVAFLDADDLWAIDKLAAQLHALQTHPQAAVAYSWTDYIDEAGQFLYPGSYVTANGRVLEKLIVQNFIESGSNPLIRRQSLAVVGNFDCALTSADDWDMWLRLAAKYDFVAVPVAQVFYRVSTTSMSTNIRYQEQVCLQVIEKALAQNPDLPRSLRQPSLANLYQYLMFRSLIGQPTRSQSLEAARCLKNALLNDPLLFQKRPRLMTIVSLKIVSLILLPAWMIPFLRRLLKDAVKRNP